MTPRAHPAETVTHDERSRPADDGRRGRAVGMKLAAAAAVLLGLLGWSWWQVAAPMTMDLVPIPPGTFVMGSTGGDPDEMPPHPVTLTRPFLLGRFEVTQGQYRQVMAASPSTFHGADDLPVESVSWFDAVRFCNALSVREGLPPYYRIEEMKDRATVTVPDPVGVGYRLPTEAEWEYACQPDDATDPPSEHDPDRLGALAWFQANSGDRTHPVGTMRANRFGLSDMLGNVWEWCWDRHAPSYADASGSVEDPTGPETGPLRVVRGGSYESEARYVRRTNRVQVDPSHRYAGIGFRVARNAPAAP